ncbi:MAG TPA: ribosomal-processing cysteine protease Prp [Thermovirgaceae bacterium]|jgi:hypothetical protein|nr:ribosomal-processing cysteine protease Prp [Thermovirgaceae bacterium]
MTEIRILRCGDIICGIEISGHSGYAGYGKDIVCAALSTLAQTLEIGLTDVLDIDNVVSTKDPVSGYARIFWGNNDSSRINDLAKTIVAALVSISKSYPAYTKIVEVYVNENF